MDEYLITKLILSVLDHIKHQALYSEVASKHQEIHLWFCLPMQSQAMKDTLDKSIIFQDTSELLSKVGSQGATPLFQDPLTVHAYSAGLLHMLQKGQMNHLFVS